MVHSPRFHLVQEENLMMDMAKKRIIHRVRGRSNPRMYSSQNVDELDVISDKTGMSNKRGANDPYTQSNIDAKKVMIKQGMVNCNKCCEKQ